MPIGQVVSSDKALYADLVAIREDQCEPSILQFKINRVQMGVDPTAEGLRLIQSVPIRGEQADLLRRCLEEFAQANDFTGLDPVEIGWIDELRFFP